MFWVLNSSFYVSVAHLGGKSFTKVGTLKKGLTVELHARELGSECGLYQSTIHVDHSFYLSVLDPRSLVYGLHNSVHLSNLKNLSCKTWKEEYFCFSLIDNLDFMKPIMSLLLDCWPNIPLSTLIFFKASPMTQCCYTRCVWFCVRRLLRTRILNDLEKDNQIAWFSDLFSDFFYFLLSWKFLRKSTKLYERFFEFLHRPKSKRFFLQTSADYYFRQNYPLISEWFLFFEKQKRSCGRNKSELRSFNPNCSTMMVFISAI